MSANLGAFIVLFALALITAGLVLALLCRGLGRLLDALVGLPACTAFYTRLLAVGLSCIALAAALGTSFDLKADAACMEYVWKIADGLSSALGEIALFLGLYLVLITILVAALRRHRD